MKPRPTPETDPEAVPAPFTWGEWTPELIDQAMPTLLKLARIAARVAEQVEREAADPSQDAA